MSAKNNNRIRFFLAVCFVLLTCVLAIGEAQGGVDIPVPRWLDPVPVGDMMIINGLPSTVHYFKVERAANEVLEFYRNRWETAEDGSRPGYREVKAEYWHIISRLSDKRYLMTVQVKSTGTFTSTGYLAVGDLKKMETKPSIGKDVPKMQGSKVVNDLTSFDPGKKGRTLLVVNGFSVQSNSEFYRTYYRDRNWSQLVDLPQEGGHILAYRRSGQEAHLVINKKFDSTQIVINLIENM